MTKMKSALRQAYALFGSKVSTPARMSAGVLLVCLILSLMLVPTLAQELGDPAVGASLWPTLPCMGCHGDQAQGGFGPRLAGTGLSYEAVLLQVRSGGGGMPAFDSLRVSDEQVRHMHAWLQSLKEQASVPSIEVPYPIDNLLQFFGTVSEVKVRSDFAKDVPERLARVILRSSWRS